MNQATAVNPAQAATPQGFSIWAVVSFLFMCALAYHYIIWGYNYRYSPAEDNWFTAGIMAIVLIPLAFLERPATIMLVNAIRLKDNFLVLVFWFAIVCGLGFMAFNITMSSHETMAEQRDNRVSSHTSNLETVNRLEDTAKSMLAAAKQNAKGMTSERSAGYLAAAKVQYNRAMTKASEKRSQQYQDAPVKQEHKGEFDWLTAAVQSALIGLAFSLGAIIVTIYEQMHIKTTQRIPAFSLAPKLGQEWQAFKENFTAGNFDVDPTRGFFNGMFFKVKKQVTSPSERTHYPRNSETTAQNNAISGDGKPSQATGNKTENSGKTPSSGGKQSAISGKDSVKKSGRVYIQCPNCEALYNPEVSSIEPAEGNSQGKVRCQECAEPFVGLDNVLDDETAKQIIRGSDDNSVLSYDGYTLAALRDEGFEHHYNMGRYYFVLPSKDGTATCLVAHPDETKWLYIAKMDTDDLKELHHGSSETGGPYQDFHWAIAEYEQIKNKTKEKGPGGPYFDGESFYDIESRGHTTSVDGVPVLSSSGYALIPHPIKPAWIFREEFQTKHPIKWMRENPSKPNSVKFKNAITQYKQLANGDAEVSAARNSDESRVPSEFPTSSRRVHEDNQEVTDDKNSAGTQQKLIRNSTETRGGSSFRDPEPKKTGKTRQVDLSGITQTDDKQVKLKELASTIDRLSADPEYDGVFFSPKYTAKKLHMSYDPVKSVFDQKKAEGKISTDRRCKIIYRAGE